jgi:hypothetical protein
VRRESEKKRETDREREREREQERGCLGQVDAAAVTSIFTDIAENVGKLQRYSQVHRWLSSLEQVMNHFIRMA